LPSNAARLVPRIEELRRRIDHRVAVGISGPDCAGKSKLARELAEALGASSLVVRGDEFTRPTAERYAEADQALGYYRDSFDYGELRGRLLPALRDGLVGDVALRVSDWEHDGWRTETFSLRPETLLIVEGCFLFADGGDDEFDLTVWIDLPLEQVVERALARPRDLERMGGPDGVRERYARRYVPGQRLHLERDDPSRRADVVLPAAG
jgi:uridine kinase